ncbi:MAG: arginase [Fimbriimonas sp.]
MIDIIGAAFDLCGLWEGSRLGPAAIRLAGLQRTLEGMGYEVKDLGDISCKELPSEEGLTNFSSLLACVRDLRHLSLLSLQQGRLPLVLGGDHTLAVAGVSAALQHYGEGVGLLWIDAHADINTPGTSTTGNLHGMPLAALAGMPSGVEGVEDEQWRQILHALEPGPRLKPERIAWYGIRDVDDAEKPRLTGLAITMHEIDRYGIVQTLERFDSWLRSTNTTHLWVSFDVDALDPVLAPGTGTGVRGGLSYREAHLMAELMWEATQKDGCPYRLAGLDVVETNPLRDTNNSTALMAVEWIASLLGKSIV